MAIPDRVKNKMKGLGLKGVNQPKRTPNHPTKEAVVMASENGKYKLIRFGDQNAKQVGSKPKNEAERKKRASFKARHAKNIAKGKMSAAYWADKFLW